MSNPNDINLAVCKMLGIDYTRVRSVHINLLPGKLPEVWVSRYIHDVPEDTVLQRFTLVEAPNEH